MSNPRTHRSGDGRGGWPCAERHGCLSRASAILVLRQSSCCLDATLDLSTSPGFGMPAALHVCNQAHLIRNTHSSSDLRAVIPIASHRGEPGSVPGRVTGFSHVLIVPDNVVGRRVFGDLPFSPVPSFRCCSILTSIALIGSQDLAGFNRRAVENTEEKMSLVPRTPAAHASKMASLTSNARAVASARGDPRSSSAVTLQFLYTFSGITWADYSPPSKSNRVRFPARSLPGFPDVGTVPNDASGRRVSSGISRVLCTCIAALLHTHTASQISPLHPQGAVSIAIFTASILAVADFPPAAHFSGDLILLAHRLLLKVAISPELYTLVNARHFSLPCLFVRLYVRVKSCNDLVLPPGSSPHEGTPQRLMVWRIENLHVSAAKIWNVPLSLSPAERGKGNRNQNVLQINTEIQSAEVQGQGRFPVIRTDNVTGTAKTRPSLFSLSRRGRLKGLSALGCQPHPLRVNHHVQGFPQVPEYFGFAYDKTIPEKTCQISTACENLASDPAGNRTRFAYLKLGSGAGRVAFVRGPRYMAGVTNRHVNNVGVGGERLEKTPAKGEIAPEEGWGWARGGGVHTPLVSGLHPPNLLNTRPGLLAPALAAARPALSGFLFRRAVGTAARTQYADGQQGFHVHETSRTLREAGGFSRAFPSPSLAFRRFSGIISFHLHRLFIIKNVVSPLKVPYVHSALREHCTPVQSPARNGDGALVECASVTLIAPALLDQKIRKTMQSGPPNVDTPNISTTVADLEMRMTQSVLFTYSCEYSLTSRPHGLSRCCFFQTKNNWANEVTGTRGLRLSELAYNSQGRGSGK
ncbi:hypothetical protein PR048_029087 [Dryococelus australis]|uniref:Uncharacterized protein n=1 Tax=Dryococelus australis TaxID=614101 RepID=A0ABQ9GFV9_9NEOP|nr:hypothetical protein PR048_029087 [Dryococelus australis]